ncbi:hypothetical protein [Leptobacterium sp. I13]|uniref:hypothetical protein n=1 Tax=Leptobacterium meishanense TaxID=3128904 RepID=UPI0030EDD75C
MKKIIYLFLFTGIMSFAQKNINNYKYVIIPKQFDFLKKENQYRVNTLVKLLFEENGFTAFYEGENMPEDLARDNCLGLKADVVNNSNFFTTKLIVELKDCYKNVIYRSKEGKSKEKDFEKTYHAAIRDAFSSIESLNYTYQPKQEAPQEKTKKKVVKAEEPVQDIKEKETKTKEEKKPIQQSKELIETPIKEELEDVLYAQPIANGYQLVDSAPAVVYVLQKTTLENVFILKNKQGILYKKGNDWIMEYYEKNKLKQERLKIKF